MSVKNVKNSKTILFAPHDDGSGAFAVLYRLARAMVNHAENRGLNLDLIFLYKPHWKPTGFILPIAR